MALQSIRLPLAILLVLVPVSLPVRGQNTAPAEQERFTTGPPANEPARVPGAEKRTSARSDDLLDREFALPDGTDIRVNQVLGSAQNETSFAVSPTDPMNWVGVANDYRFGTVETGWYSTQDGGQTWTTGTFGIDPGFSFSGDPAVCFDPNGNPVVICMMYFGPAGSKVTAFRSTNKGLTWNSGVLIDLDSSNDKPQVNCDLSSGPLNGEITTAWDRFGAPGGDHIYVSTSTDGGLSWSTSQRINDSSNTTTISPDVTHGPNSEIYVAWADRGLNQIYVDKSTDGGATWGTDTLVSGFGHVPSPIPGSSFRMFDIFSIAADVSAASKPYSGNVYVAYHHWTGAHADIRLATSTDGGASFPQNVVVNSSDATSADQVMPGICVDTKGNVNVSFFDRRLDVSNFLLWTWAARSSDGGLTFVNHRASDVGWNHVPTEFSSFIGDYIDMECSEKNVYPFWCDGRSGSQDVYTDVLNLDIHSNVSHISSGVGGSVEFTINVGPNFGDHRYVVVASSSGTEPGMDVNGVHIPINFDRWTRIGSKLAGTSFFTNTVGRLDATGSTTAGTDTGGPRPFLNGLVLDWVVIVTDDSFNPLYASAPTRVTYGP